MFNAKKIVSLVMSAIISSTMVTAIPANAKVYKNKCAGFKAVKDLKLNDDGNIYGMKFESMQGIAGDSSYIYVAKNHKISESEQYAVIFRLNPNNKNEAPTLMSFDTKKNNEKNVAGDLNHANDMFLLKENGIRYLYVNTGEGQIIKLQINDSKKKLKKVKRITVNKYGNTRLKFSGLSGFEDELYNKSKYKIILKDKNEIYTATINKNNTNESITAQKKFDLYTSVKLPGKDKNGKSTNVPHDLSESKYANQGISYYNGDLYVTYSMNSKDTSVPHNKSVIIIYKNVYNKLNNSGTSTIAKPYGEAKFYFESGPYSDLFEIEGCAIVNNTVFFNTNRRKTASDADYDAVLYLSDYRP